MKRALFLDRDGVINKLVSRDGGWYSPRKLEDFEFREGIREFASLIRSSGFEIVVVTNQPDVARGLLDLETLLEMHRRVQSELKTLDILVCPHQESDNCSCRKPKPGMINAASAKYGIDKNRSFLLGDQERDLVAGRLAGVRSLGLISSTGIDEARFSGESRICASFSEVLAQVLQQ